MAKGFLEPTVGHTFDYYRSNFGIGQLLDQGGNEADLDASCANSISKSRMTRRRAADSTHHTTR
ncbi:MULTISPECIES: hypothetical protein [Nitrosomonas]|uniref:Uncharacterized protein n=1 Tax=Nitrosomonas communis TaxID=44574 RepID=A0A0F7KE46_9PROT|nr:MULTISPECIES: hypothetical protein [Nitrosomonas]AKH37771.1 hypothetical protein AAW31_08070 [Nitrosomonas communis]TYP81091.1 hypothetical protein BCL69_105428 [Nitrosomonas communis]UVS63109.1 hypothetical protein NX761_08465 [Nitrosomonas sp. PLL12]